MGYITFHVQKDKRWSTGTAIHKYAYCPNLKNRTGIISVEGTIAAMMPKCSWCYSQSIKETKK